MGTISKFENKKFPKFNIFTHQLNSIVLVKVPSSHLEVRAKPNKYAEYTFISGHIKQ